MIAYPRAGEADFTATWIGHSTVLLQFGGLNVLTDPVFSQRAFPVQWMGPRRVMDPGLPIDALPPIDIVVLSHNHYDHLDKPAVKRIAAAHPESDLDRAARPRRVHPALGRPRDRGAGLVAAARGQRRSDHGDAGAAFQRPGPRDRNRSLWCGFAFEVDGKRALFAGDTAYHPEFGADRLAVRPVRLRDDPDRRVRPSLVHARRARGPGGGGADLPGPGRAASRPAACRSCSASIGGRFRLTDEPMDEPPRRTAARWRAAGLDEDRLWIARFGETRRLTR